MININLTVESLIHYKKTTSKSVANHLHRDRQTASSDFVLINYVVIYETFCLYLSEIKFLSKKIFL